MGKGVALAVGRSGGCAPPVATGTRNASLAIRPAASSKPGFALSGLVGFGGTGLLSGAD